MKSKKRTPRLSPVAAEIDRLLYRHTPFRPFRLSLENGAELIVNEARDAAMNKRGDALYFFGDETVFVELTKITEVIQ